VVGICYAIAANLASGSDGQEFLRGFMIGFNAGMNAAMAWSFFCPYASVTIGVIGALAASDKVASNSVYQGILGWSSWVMPMSWTITAIGLIFFVVNCVGWYITNDGDWWGSRARIEDLHIDWRTGTVVMAGGVTAYQRKEVNGYNLGNFVYVNPKTIKSGTYDEVVSHETGHTLNTGAFGSAFGLYTWIDQGAYQNYFDAYGEMLAESHADHPGMLNIPMWS
jgi:hypothetical protein